ncbi:Vms1/Ankzf1 family peptidyl-tRNA hydrolase [Kutzneria sp. NPDC052558]|uniref:Rv2629 family ribosome hibernation factor n=1 Tax=Kutzneria sp. NPDC052558 TaxID=3364121 RepID=UPI0037CC0A10
METTELRDLVVAPGDFASVYLDASHDTEDAEQALRLRWQEIRAALEDQHADRPTVRELEQTVLEGAKPVGRAGRALIASAGRVLLDTWLPVPPATPVVRWSTLPYLLPLAAQHVPPLPYVVVITDRLGADLRGYGPHGELTARTTVDGVDHPVHKVAGTGWTHLKMQHRVENTAHHNATEVAEAVSRMADDLHAQLIIVAAEVQARAELHEALPKRHQEILVDTSTGGRADGIDEAALEAEVRLIAEDYARAAQQTWVDRFAAELARDTGLAVQGLEPVTAALREARVDTVIVTDELAADRPLWTGEELAQVAIDAEGLAEDGRLTRRADEALPAAASVSGANLVVPDGHLPLADGVGALLRY